MQIRNVSRLAFLGACFSSGQPIKGTQTAPDQIRKSGLFQSLKQNYVITITDHGNIYQTPNFLPSTKKSHIQNLNILDPSLKNLNDKISDIVKVINDDEEILVTVGGDHSIATASIHAMLGKYGDLKVIWVDAHGDIIDVGQSSYPGYHGMPLSHLIGINDGKIPGFEWLTRRLKPQNIVYIGLRDIDADEWITIKKYHIKCFTPDHIDKFGIGVVMLQAMEYLDPIIPQSASNKSVPFHISFDIDAMDPRYCQGTGTKYRGGLTPREAVHIIRSTNWKKKVVSMDLVEINPLLEKRMREKYRGDEKYRENLGQTVGMGVDLIQSLFKKYFTL